MPDILYVPDIDENIPLPKSAAEAFPELSPHEELQMRARTVKLISDLSGQPLIPDGDDVDQATIVARAMMENPKLRPEFAKYTNETMAFLAGLVQQSNCQIVEELSELKNYVTNKLIMEVENASMPKDRIAALRLLGEIDGIDAFKRRSEVTMQIKPIEEVEKELSHIINAIEFHTIEPSGANNDSSSSPDHS
jgi:hypothetical protein